MAEAVQIQCINKSDRQNAHERIKNVGGVHNGTRWKMSEDQAIVGIEQGQWTFYVLNRSGQRVAVVIATRNGRKYLKTVADGEQPDNLLSLPECP